MSVRSGLARTVRGLSVCTLACLALPATAFAAASLPGSPPVTQSEFKFEAAGSKPADGDGLIPAPSTPQAPTCTVTLTAPSNGAVTAVQERINADVKAGTAFTGDTICLSGTFKAPIHVRNKFSSALLTIAPAPGASAIFNLSGRAPTTADQDPNEDETGDSGVTGAVDIGDSRDVELYGLTIENWVTTSAALIPAGIYVAVWSNPGAKTASACFSSSTDHACGDIFLYRNTVEFVENNAKNCNPDEGGNINAYGIAIKGFGQNSAYVLQHVVLEDNTVTHTATGQSETVSVDGNVADFLVAGNTITKVNNIGLDMIGWETGTNALSQARYGYAFDNRISGVDNTTDLNGYGSLSGSTCEPGDDAAGGLYVDGGSHLWIDDNTVTNTNHGIELGVENNNDVSGAFAGNLLVTRNTVSDSAGSTYSGSSYAGHADDALMIDGGAGFPATVRDVYVHGNSFTNDSQFYSSGGPPPAHPQQAPVVDLNSSWQSVWLLDNTITADGSSDKVNPLLSVDSNPGGTPTEAPGVVVDCNTYDGLSTDGDNFQIDSNNNSPWGPLADYQAQNALPTSELGLKVAHRGWDADSAAQATPHCPFTAPS